MAEAVAIVGLVASIASLVDLSAKVVSRLHELTSKSVDVPKSFRSLGVGLPLLTLTLKDIQAQAEAGHLRTDVSSTLLVVVADTSEQVQILQTYLSSILLPNGASKLERGFKALESLAKEDKVKQAIERIEKNSNTLVLYQTTRHADTGDLVLAQLTELTLTSRSTLGSFGKNELLSLAQATVKTTLEELPPQTQSVLSNSSRELLIRFSQLPVAAQKKFVAQQENQLRQFVEQEEVKVLRFLTEFDTQERLADMGRHKLEGSCDWILQTHDYLEWAHGKCNRLCLLGDPGTGKTVISAFITEALDKGLGEQDILAVYACSFTGSQKRSATSILCALAGQIAQGSHESMNKCKRFLERHTSEGRLKPQLLELQDLIVEMSLSTDIRQVFIVIDGLDEGEWDQSDHLSAVVDIPQRARKLKMLVTSRPDPLIERALCEYRIISMNYERLYATLDSYVDKELENSKLADLSQPDLQEIKASLLNKSNGMYVSSLIDPDHVCMFNTNFLFRRACE